MKPYENLANAIIMQAVKDYRKALKQLKQNKKYSPAKQQKRAGERFFRSEWYTELTSVNGEFLMKKLQEEVLQ